MHAGPTSTASHMTAAGTMYRWIGCIGRCGTAMPPARRCTMVSSRTKSTVRVRVEHVFGARANDKGGAIVRTIDLARAKAGIGMKNLA